MVAFAVDSQCVDEKLQLARRGYHTRRQQLRRHALALWVAIVLALGLGSEAVLWLGGRDYYDQDARDGLVFMLIVFLFLGALSCLLLLIVVHAKVKALKRLRGREPWSGAR